MHHVGRQFAVLAISTLLITGCSDSTSETEPDGTSSSSATATESAAPEPATEAAVPDPPVPPAEATEHTPEGSQAFALFYVDVMNYSLVTAYRPEPLLEYATDRCGTCEGYAVAAAELAEEGRTQEGGWFTVREVDTLIPDYGTEGGTYLVLEVDELTIRQPDDTVDVYEAMTYPIAVYPIWTDDGWRIQWISVPE